jgi:hypothetical protein
LIFAGLGELVAEKSGVINLGVEGMMLIGAVAGFAAAPTRGAPSQACCLALWQACWRRLIFAFLTLSLAANQSACGLATDHLRHRPVGLHRPALRQLQPARPEGPGYPRTVPHSGARPHALQPAAVVYLAFVIYGACGGCWQEDALGTGAARGR